MTARAALLAAALLAAAPLGAALAACSEPSASPAASAPPAREPIPATIVAPGYPRPQLARRDWLSLDGSWQLAEASATDAPPFKTTLAETISVPFPVEARASGIGRHMDRMWYRRTFTVPTAWAGRRVLLHFGAVDWEATAWLNGRALGTHRGGFDAFSFDVTDALGEGEQELVVGVFDPTDSGDQPVGKQVLDPKWIFFSAASGIWQTVWLEPVPAARIRDVRLDTDVDAGTVRLTVMADGATRETVRTVVRDGVDVIADTAGPLDAPIGIPIGAPKLWSPNHPFLYDVDVVLENDGAIVDQVTTYFGMRKVALADVGGFLRPVLNGEFVFQVGALSHGYWPDGIYTAPSDDALRGDIERARSLGLNLLRVHVKVEPARFYYWADRLGMLLWQDMPSIGYGKVPGPDARAEFEAELESMADQHRMFPSIVAWEIFNEGWGQYDTARLTERVRALDPTRLVDSASGWTDEGVGDVIDMHLYPGPGSPDPTATRAAVLGEYGWHQLWVPGHEWKIDPWHAAGLATERDAGSLELTQIYLDGITAIEELMASKGLSAAVYTMLTDVEYDGSGLFTYDRMVAKPDVARVAAANADLVAAARALR